MAIIEPIVIPRVGALNQENLRRLTASLRSDPVKAARAAAIAERDLLEFARAAFDLDEVQARQADVLLADETARQLGGAYALLLRHGGEISLELPAEQIASPRSLTVGLGISITRDPNGRITGIAITVTISKTR